MIEFARFVSDAFLPSVALGLATAVAWRYVPVGALRTALQWLAALLFFAPQPFVLSLGAYSSGLRLYQQALLSLWGFGVCAFAVARILSRKTPATSGLRKPRGKAVLAVVALMMGTLGVWTGWTVVGDYALEHQIVAGTVEGARAVRGTRSPRTYRVIIDHQSYGVTLDLLAQLQPGDAVEAEVGAASGTILAIRRNIHPRRAAPR